MASTKEILCDLISFDSCFDKSNKEIVEYISDLFKDKNEVSILKYKKENLELYNLIVKIKGKSSQNPLMFVGHTDTVHPSDKWKSNPFTPKIQGNKLYGLGASDMKAGLACIISAALSIESEPDNDIYLLFDADEEGFGSGGRNLVQEFKLESSARIIVAEPTDRNIVLGHRGCLDFDITIKGEEKHSAQADFEYNNSKNAINIASKILNSLTAYSLDIEKRKDDVLNKPVLNIGQISGGIGANVVAGKCNIKISRRFIRKESIDSVSKEISDLVKSCSSSAEVKEVFFGEVFATDKNDSFVKEVNEISKGFINSLDFVVKEGWTEAAIFAKYGKVVIFGPGSTQSIHKPEEYVLIEDLEIFKEIYKKLMLN